MLANLKRKTVTLTDDDGEACHFIIRKMSADMVEDARAAKVATQGKATNALTPDLVVALRELEASKAEKPAAELKAEEARLAADPEAARKAKLAEFDRRTTLRFCVISAGGEKVDYAYLAELDEEAAQQLFEAIVDFTSPPAAVAVAEGKGSSGESIGS